MNVRMNSPDERIRSQVNWAKRPTCDAHKLAYVPYVANHICNETRKPDHVFFSGRGGGGVPPATVTSTEAGLLPPRQ